MPTQPILFYSLLDESRKFFSSFPFIIQSVKLCKVEWWNVTYRPQVYETSLEKYGEHDFFKDFCNTFELQRGKQDDDDEEEDGVGEFKVRWERIINPPLVWELGKTVH